jgi:hypothetical protein
VQREGAGRSGRSAAGSERLSAWGGSLSLLEPGDGDLLPPSSLDILIYQRADHKMAHIRC